MDPFSAASGAVGIISLGIHVCQGFISCYSGWKDCPEDIDRANKSILTLQNIFELLQSSLETPELDNSRRLQAQNCVESCAEGIAKLSSKLSKFGKTQTQTNTSKIQWTSLQRAMYPFRRATIEKLQKIVSELQYHCQTAVQVLQLDADIKSLQKLDTVDAKVAITEMRTASIEFKVAELSLQNKKVLDTIEIDALKRWIGPPDPEVNHQSARRSCQARTGRWLLDSKRYKDWKAGANSCKHLWVHGKAGSGKSVLCSTAIEDVRSQCADVNKSICVMFYFTFSDESKQSYHNFLRSVLFQLAIQDPGYSVALASFKKSQNASLRDDALEDIILGTLIAYENVFLMIDALDESPEINGSRESLFDGLQKLISKALNLKAFMTSRDLHDIADFVESVGVTGVPMASAKVNGDIRAYVEAQISRDRKLSGLDKRIKNDIHGAICDKADGTFRWAYCQIEALRALKSLKPKYIRKVLISLPATLDATYDRMLLDIDQMFRHEATVLLKWIAYASRPLTLSELAEASIVDPYGETWVDIENRGSLGDTLGILGGLVTLEMKHRVTPDSDSDIGSIDRPSSQNKEGDVFDDHREDYDQDVDVVTAKPQSSGHSSVASICEGDQTVRLAHFSVKEYLESDRMSTGDLTGFRLSPVSGHEHLAQSCAVYFIHLAHRVTDDMLINYDKDQCAQAWPLLTYARWNWDYHAKLQGSPTIDRVFDFVSSNETYRIWSRFLSTGWGPNAPDSALHLIAYHNLTDLTERLLKRGIAVDLRDARQRTALEIATTYGNIETIDVLVQYGADVNAPDDCWSALQRAAVSGQNDIVARLLELGANVHHRDWKGRTVLSFAVLSQELETVRMILDHGGALDINVADKSGDSPLTDAIRHNHLDMAKLLLDYGAEANTHYDGTTGYCYEIAYARDDKMRSLLISYGAVERPAFNDCEECKERRRREFGDGDDSDEWEHNEDDEGAEKNEEAATVQAK